jgi:hypothetical protein
VPVTLDLAPDLENKVLIADAAAFKKIGDPPADGGWFGLGKSFLLLRDLTLDNWAGPKIQGDAYASPQERAFFDGGGHTVRINSFAAEIGNYGLFTDAYLADFYNLNIALDITSADNTEVYWGAGGLTPIGSNITVKDVHVSGTLYVSSTNSYGSFAGGIAGEITGGGITACSSKLDIKMENYGGGSSGSSVGGLLGEMNGVGIYESFSSGTVEGTRAGGILGSYIDPGDTLSPSNSIKFCYSDGTVRGINPGGQALAGGIAGRFMDRIINSEIWGSYSVAEVACDGTSSGGSSSRAGGITGYLAGASSKITNSLALNSSISGNDSNNLMVHRVAGGFYGTGTGNSAWDGMTLTGNHLPVTPISNSTNTDGADFSLSTPPVAADFSGTAFDPSDPSNDFAMPPEGWDYPYPVFQWQIDKGIRP